MCISFVLKMGFMCVCYDVFYLSCDYLNSFIDLKSIIYFCSDQPWRLASVIYYFLAIQLAAALVALVDIYEHRFGLVPWGDSCWGKFSSSIERLGWYMQCKVWTHLCPCQSEKKKAKAMLYTNPGLFLIFSMAKVLTSGLPVAYCCRLFSWLWGLVILLGLLYHSLSVAVLVLLIGLWQAIF